MVSNVHCLQNSPQSHAYHLLSTIPKIQLFPQRKGTEILAACLHPKSLQPIFSSTFYIPHLSKSGFSQHSEVETDHLFICKSTAWFSSLRAGTQELGQLCFEMQQQPGNEAGSDCLGRKWPSNGAAQKLLA